VTDRDIRAETTDEGIEAKVEALLAQLTLEEKAGQLTQYFYFGANAVTADPIGELGTQPALVEAALAGSAAGGLLFVTDPAQINRLQRLAINGNRLGIPALFGFDLIHGLRTIFPVPIAMAATWDPDLIAAGNRIAAREARAVGIHWAFAPNVDIARDPRWGRIIEGAGEDPYLGAAVAAAQVHGFQGERLGAPDHVVAGPKHFAGYGAAIGGRDYDEVDLSDSELWNTYLVPFKAAVDAGAGNIMPAYMPLNGVPATGNRWLVTDVLRDTWGFDGFVVSDAGAVQNLETHHFAVDKTDAAAKALHAGVDMEMTLAGPAFEQLAAAVRAGSVSEAELDAAVSRVLRVKLLLGLFEEPYVDEVRSLEVLGDPGHREAARVAAEKSAVLLRNEGELLPLSRDRTSVAVVGALADSRRDTLGPWAFDFDLGETVTVVEGIRAYLGPAARVEYAPGVGASQRSFGSIFDLWPGNIPVDPDGFDPDHEFGRAVALAASAEVAVVVLGEWQNMVGENASRSSLELPGRQLELLQAVIATGTPTVLVVMSGRPVDLRWAAEHVPAILQVWYPGTRGGDAAARLLFGEVAPTGKLPFSWPRTVGQVPIFYSHTRSFQPETQQQRYWDEASTPLFPFGHGLSYSTFEYSAIRVSRNVVALNESVTVSADVTNTSARDGVDVAQLYLHQRSGSAVRPIRLLKGFQQVAVPAGATVRIQFEVGPEERRYWSAAVRDWILEPSTFDVWIGGSSVARLGGGFRVE